MCFSPLNSFLPDLFFPFFFFKEKQVINLSRGKIKAAITFFPLFSLFFGYKGYLTRNLERNETFLFNRGFLLLKSHIFISRTFKKRKGERKREKRTKRKKQKKVDDSRCRNEWSPFPRGNRDNCASSRDSILPYSSLREMSSWVLHRSL